MPLVIAVGTALAVLGLTPITVTVAVLVILTALLTAPRVTGADQPHGMAGNAPAPPLPEGRQQPVRNGPARRAVLTGTALGAATVLGEATRRRPPPMPDGTDDISLTDYADLAIDRRDPADPSSWDWTPALREAVRISAGRAITSRRIDGSAAYRRTGLPTIRIPRGRYRMTGSVVIRYLHGLTVTGDGRQVSVLVFEGDDALFDIHRSSALTFSGLTITGQDPAAPVEADIQGLREGSCGFRFTERADDDNVGGGNTYQCTFVGVEVNELHRAFAFAGDQMTDGMIWNDLRMRDNFVDFDYANSQAVNHQVFGGEVLYGVSFAEQSYALRLQTWTTAPDLRDGAVLDVSTGGDISVFGGSLITRKPTLAFSRPPQDNSQGVVSNVLGYNFFGTRWELRDHDTVGDESGLQRSTLVRWHVPVPDNRDVQPTLRFDGCRFLLTVDDIDLLYLTNAVAISWDGCRVFPPTRGQVVTLVGPDTARLPGAFLADGSSVLPVVRRVMAATPASVDHVVEVSSRGAPDVGRGGSTAGHSTVVTGVPSTARRVLHRHPEGYLLAPGQQALEAQLRVPSGALVKQIGAVVLPTTDEDVSVTVTADGRSIADLVAGPSSDKPIQLVEQFVDSGFLLLTASRDGTEPIYGYVYTEYF